MFPSRWFGKSAGQSQTARLAAAAFVALGLQSAANAQSAPDDYYSARAVPTMRQPADDRNSHGFQPPRRDNNQELRNRAENTHSRDDRPDGDDRGPGGEMRHRESRPNGPMGQRGEAQRRMDNVSPEERERFRERMQDMRERFNNRNSPHGRPAPHEQVHRNDRRPMNSGPGHQRMEDRREFPRDFGPQRFGPRPGPRHDMQMRGGPDRNTPPHGRHMPDVSRERDRASDHRFGPNRNEGPRQHTSPGGPMHRDQFQHRSGPDHFRERGHGQGPEHRPGKMHHEGGKKHGRKLDQTRHNDQDRASQHEMRRRRENHDQRDQGQKSGPQRRNDDRRDRDSDRQPMPPRGAQQDTPQSGNSNDAA